MNYCLGRFPRIDLPRDGSFVALPLVEVVRCGQGRQRPSEGMERIENREERERGGKHVTVPGGRDIVTFGC
jgi:hypothetical protein